MNKANTIKDAISRYRLARPGRGIPVGVGCAWLGRSGTSGPNADRDLGILLECYERGFCYFDTSRQYGQSECIVGQMVRRVPRDSIFLATKSPFPREAGADRRNFQIFRSNFYESFERLQCDVIDLFQIHDTDHYECCAEEVIPFLLERQSEGLIRHIGMGTRSLNAHELAVRSGVVQSALSYLNYSLLKRSAQPLIEVCRAYGAAFINAAVLHYGLVIAADPLTHCPEDTRPHADRNRRTAAAMQALCREMGVPVLAAALQFPLLNPDVDMTLIGIGSREILDANLEALATTIHPEQWARIDALQRQQPYLFVQDDLA